jgi:hypothetical protein
MAVFKLTGKGQVELGEHPQVSLAASGERTCQQLRALLPPSEARSRLEQFLETRQGKAALTQQVRLGVSWDRAAGSALQPQWQFQGGCGLAPWPAPPSDQAGTPPGIQR